MGIPLFLLSPPVQGQTEEKENAAKVAEKEKTAEEKGNALLAKETAKRAKEAAKERAEAAERGKEVPKEVSEVAETKKTEEEKINAQRAKIATERAKMAAAGASETAKNAAELAQTKKIEADKINAERDKIAPERIKAAKERAEDAAARGKENAEPAKGRNERPGDPRIRPNTPAIPATPATPASPTSPTTPAIPATPATPPAQPAEGSKPPVATPVVPAGPLTPREGMKPRGRETLPAKESTPEPALGENAKRAIVKIAPSEPERLAETKVTEVTREVQRDIDLRKTRLTGPEQAQALIKDLLGAESQISRAEIAREERFRPRFQQQRPGEERRPEVSPDQRRAATTYYQERLRGREVEGAPPEFFRRSDRRDDGREVRPDQRIVERVEYVRPRYLNEGRRYVHYDSRAAIPAILMAAQAMNQVRFQPTREITTLFHESRDVSTTDAIPLPPENYRTETSWVVSYPVDEKSMISSEDILFLQGSTQFSDPYSYDVIGVMADAMKAMPEEERFVIEGHASAEGSYESNMILSQERAEHIVREIVRRGVSPYRLLPVGYGESEARNLAESAENLRSQDRRVVVFRMKPEPIAQR